MKRVFLLPFLFFGAFVNCHSQTKIIGENAINNWPALNRSLLSNISQFFDHYLKGVPAPKWMVEGIPAVKKGIDNG